MDIYLQHKSKKQVYREHIWKNMKIVVKTTIFLPKAVKVSLYENCQENLLWDFLLTL